MNIEKRVALTKVASEDVLDGDAAEIAKAYDDLLSSDPRALRKASIVGLRDEISTMMTNYAKRNRGDGEGELDAYARLMAEDDGMAKLYEMHARVGDLLGQVS